MCGSFRPLIIYYILMKRNFILFTIISLLIAGCSSLDEPVPPEEGKIIVLMYHRIVNGEATNLYERSVKDFEADLKYIVDNDIKVIDFNNLERIMASGKMPEGNSAVITFDDGDHSCYTLARPLLLEYKMNATFFLWTYMIGHDSFLSWNEVELMSNYMYSGGDSPFIFGSHTYSHQYLLQRKSGFNTTNEYNYFLDYELGESKRLIESHTRGKVSVLSLPFGDGAEDTDIISAAKRNGYIFIRTSIWGAIGNPTVSQYAIPSLPMLDATDPDQIGYYLNL
jgi:peptidoglycan/xylan/chitin deacetylase (PgdA/CDA1 family)